MNAENKEALQAWLRHLADAASCCEYCLEMENTEEAKKRFMERYESHSL